MTGTPSRTATVPTARWDRKEAVCTSRPEEHEGHLRQRLVGEGAELPEAQCHPDHAVVYATGIRDERRASYPGRSAVRSMRTEPAAQRVIQAAEVSKGQYPAAMAGEGRTR
jgi:hypothetical protein